VNRRQFVSTSAQLVTAGLLLPGFRRTDCLAAGSTGAQQAPGAAPTRRPNILVILADDLGYGGLGVQGCRDIPTPNVDSLAQNGTRFTDGYVSCPLCSPTRAGLMTGRYQQRFGHEGNPGPQAAADSSFGLPRTEMILPERMRALGYRTGMVGKWHLGFKPELQPPQRGFDEFFGFLAGASSYLPRAAARGASNPILRGMEPVTEKEYLTDAFAREAVAFIDSHRRDPFFLYLAFNAVHAPLETIDKYRLRFSSIKDDTRRTHAAMLAALDDAVGRVLVTLRERDLERETLIFFLSDNGGPTLQTTSSNAPLRGQKGQMWEGGIRVPFIVQWKGHLPAGRVCRHPVISLDILPTAVAAAGGTISPDWKLDGVDLLPVLGSDAAARPHETLYWRMFEKHAVRHGDWKLVVETGQRQPALFNLAEDIGERNDLAGKMPGKVAELDGIYRAWDAQLAKPAWARQGGVTRPGQRQIGNARQAGTADEQFKRLDRNQDGKLTPDEVGRPRQFRLMDRNSDGVVTLEEVRAFLKGRGGTGPA
jgi:arylsulfatase A-like enzyme